MVDVFYATADNTVITDKAQLRSCHFLKKGMETKTKKCVRNPNEWQEVRHSHIIAEVCESRWRKGLCTL